MSHKHHRTKHKKSALRTIPPTYAEYPPMITRWTTDIDRAARHKNHKLPRALRHHYD